ncbi:hypothetical protein AADU91_000658 [Klebsiella michiganensis]
MTVSTEVDHNDYTGNGVTTQYDFTFRVLDKSHLLVQILDASENITTLVLGSDYTVTGVNRYTGGKVVLTSALPAGYKISIERSTPVTQEASIRNQGGFFPEIHEDAFDKLTMLVQQAYGWWSGLSLRKPSWLANYYDALNNRIRNLRDPSQAQDAATKNYVDESIVGSNGHADDLFKRTLRVPENEVPQYFSVPVRSNMLVGCNDAGRFVPIAGQTDTADLAIKLSGSSGADLIGFENGDTVGETLTNILSNRLSFYGNNASSLIALLSYAADSGVECVIDVDVNLTSILNFDAAGKVINLRFDASINSDDQLLWLTHLGRGSVIKNPWFKNITTPWVISRFDSSGNVLTPGAAVLATLQQTNDEIGYQPTASDSDIYSSLSDDVKNQQICAGMIIAYSDGVDVVEPRGRYMALEFIQCNNCRVISPSFMAGKHQYGSILFSNTLTSAWGYGNCVIGGEIRYGSVSGAVFMRQRGASGGVFGGFKPYRPGESGVKTYQNNVDGRSARCYQMTFDGITAHQCGYDGVDVFADYGVQEERVDDYTLAEYAWGMLPTAHKVSNIIATDCGVTGTGTGMTADGQFNTYSNIIIEKSRSSGIFHSGKNNYLMNIFVKNGNMNSAAAGAQIRMLGVSSISGATIITDASVVTAGYGLFTTDAGTSLNNINLDGTALNSQPRYPAKQNLRLGRTSSTDMQCSIFANPQPTILANPCGAVHFDLTYALSGSERGNVSLLPVYGGAEVKGLRARGEYGGFAIHGVSSQSNAAYLNNGEVMFYESSGALKLQFKGSSGAVITYTLTAG